MLLFSTLLFSLFITMALIPIFRRYAVQLNCVDVPCERKVHECPMPKVGGLAMAVGTLVPLLVWASGNQRAIAFLVGSAIIVIFGFLDDVRDLSWWAKFCAQIVAALVIIFVGHVKISCLGSLCPDGLLLPDWVAVPLTIVVIVGVTNAVNLADGLDGLAGGIMLLSFLCIGFLGYQGQNQMVTLVAVAVGGALLGFLPYNTHPATVFMGDTGSQLLGFLAGTLAVTLSQGQITCSPVFPLFMVGLPILDTTMVMIGRIARGRSPFHADKNHMHHRLLRMNFFHSEAVLILCVLQGALVTTGYILRFYSDWLLLGFYIAFATALLSIFIIANKKGWQLNRPCRFDHLVKKRLKALIKDRFVPIRVSQTIIEAGLPLLLIATCLLTGRMPLFMSIISFGLIALIGVTRLLKPSQNNNILRIVIYVFTPFLFYFSEVSPSAWISHNGMLWYDLCFACMLFFTITTLRITRRGNRYKASLFDIILLFSVIVSANILSLAMNDLHLGSITAKIIIVFFVFEVMLAELRGKQNHLSLFTIIALLIVVARAAI